MKKRAKTFILPPFLPSPPHFFRRYAEFGKLASCIIEEKVQKWGAV